MTNEAPDTVILAQKVGSDRWATLDEGHTMSMGYNSPVQYTRTDLTDQIFADIRALMASGWVDLDDLDEIMARAPLPPKEAPNDK